MRSWRLLALETPQGAKFIPPDRVDAWRPSLGAADMKPTGRQLDLVPLEIAQL